MRGESSGGGGKKEKAYGPARGGLVGAKYATPGPRSGLRVDTSTGANGLPNGPLIAGGLLLGSHFSPSTGPNPSVGRAPATTVYWM